VRRKGLGKEKGGRKESRGGEGEEGEGRGEASGTYAERGDGGKRTEDEAMVRKANGAIVCTRERASERASEPGRVSVGRMQQGEVEYGSAVAVVRRW